MAGSVTAVRAILRLPLSLLLWGVASVAMYVPAIYAVAQDNHPASQSFFYAGTMGIIAVVMIGLALGGRASGHGTLGLLLSLLATFLVLPLFLAMPLHDALLTTSYLNAYLDMVGAITTTGAVVFDDPDRLAPSLHLWRALVGWLGGLLMWVAASAILAPLSLGGFEVTARGEPGRMVAGQMQQQRSDTRQRLIRITLSLAPIYAGLTGAIWVLLRIVGEDPLTAICHAMSVMATSGISPVGGVEDAQSGVPGEAILFLFMFFALSRLTFSSDTVVRGHSRLDRDPEFRIGLLLVIGLPVLLFMRHWLAAFDVDMAEQASSALRSLWGAMFTVMSFLTTTGFESGDWATARQWSGLDTPGVILMGLALIGGGVATTAGGVKLLRVYALYLNGLREMEKLVYPNSVPGRSGISSRIQKDGAFIAWVFFMLFALSLALVSVALAACGVDFDQAMVLSVSSLSTTGPLTEIALDAPIRLAELGAVPKIILCFAMVLGRLETLAIIALFNPGLWRK